MDLIKNILFPTDFSENASNALPFAINLVKKHKAKLFLLNVYDVPLTAPDNAFFTKEEAIVNLTEDIRSSALNKLKQIITDNNLSEFQHRCFVREGNVYNQIQKTIEKNDIDLIVMGTKGKAAEKGLLMGSVTKNVIQHVSCPVLAIPEGFKFVEITKIIFATDLYQDETDEIDFVINFAKLYKATVVVLHIDHDSSTKNWSIEQLKKTVDKTTYPKVAYNELVMKDVAEGINKYISEHDANMLVVTTHVTSLFDKVFHKSITKQLLLHTHIPLLVFSKKKYDTILFG